MQSSTGHALIRGFIVLLSCSALFAAPFIGAEEEGRYVKPQERDKCPVCGMFVAKYPDWIAEVLFKDGSYAVFDGAKDLFKFYFDVPAYAVGKTQSDIRSIIVTDYYSVQPVDGRKAFFVQGSDVVGPMGRELVPFGTQGDAREFLKDHHGKRVLTFDEVTPAIIEGLDR